MNRVELSKQKSRKILSHIVKHPGVHYSEIQRHFEFSAGSLVYQLAKLEGGKHIFSRKDGFWKRFYPISMRKKRKFIEITPIQKKVVSILELSPELSIMEIAVRMKRTRIDVIYHLNPLVKKGIVKRKKSGRKYLYHVEK